MSSRGGSGRVSSSPRRPRSLEPNPGERSRAVSHPPPAPPAVVRRAQQRRLLLLGLADLFPVTFSRCNSCFSSVSSSNETARSFSPKFVKVVPSVGCFRADRTHSLRVRLTVSGDHGNFQTVFPQSLSACTDRLKLQPKLYLLSKPLSNHRQTTQYCLASILGLFSAAVSGTLCY